MKYKAVILDMDGTLLNDEKNIPHENISTLKKLHEMGLVIMVATGRRYLFAKPVLEQLGFPVVVLSNNGNCVWLMDKDCKITAKYIAENVFKDILKEGHKRNLYPILHVDHHDKGIDFVTEYEYSHPAYNQYIHKGNKRHRVVENLLEFENPNVMVMCYAGDMDKLEDFGRSIHKRHPGEVHSHITLSLKRIGPLLEISCAGGTKWETAVEFAGRFGIKPDEIVALGDDSNDINMLENAGLGIAMKNSIPQAKEAADIVTEFDNNQAGVSHVLESIFFV